MPHPSPASTLVANSAVSRIATSRLVRTARALVDLGKPRLAVMSVLTTAVAYYASRPVSSTNAFAVLAATLLSAAGALGLNEWRERDTDAIMARTRNRPLPQREVGDTTALLWSAAVGMSGVTWLAFAANLLSAAVSFATIVIYAFVYTPLKRRTRWATEIGAISGALPPLIGAAAATGHLTPIGSLIAVVLLFWQMPHFFAIGWVHRRDYRAAGFPLLPAIDHDGRRTARWCCGYSIALLLASLAGFALGAGGVVFALTSLLAGAVLLRRSWNFLVTPAEQDRTARQLFTASLAYVPLVLLAIVIERW